MKFPSRLERTAYHEAGHAVMLLTLNQKFIFVSIGPEGNPKGSIDPRNFEEKWTSPRTELGILQTNLVKLPKGEIEKQILICYAGVVAEKLKFEDFQGEGENRLLDMDSDYRSIKLCLKELNEKDTYFEKCKELLIANQSIIDTIALTLLEKKTLTFNDCKICVKKSSAEERKRVLINRVIKYLVFSVLFYCMYEMARFGFELFQSDELFSQIGSIFLFIISISVVILLLFSFFNVPNWLSKVYFWIFTVPIAAFALSIVFIVWGFITIGIMILPFSDVDLSIDLGIIFLQSASIKFVLIILDGFNIYYLIKSFRDWVHKLYK